MIKIIQEDGKDYLVTYVAKVKNSLIDANKLFLDVKEAVDIIIKGTNKEYGGKITYLSKGYGSGLQSFLNRYSGDYFSPSFMKGYQANPALSIVQNFFAEQLSDATAIGSATHKVLEIYYLLPKEERKRDKLYEICKQIIPVEQQEKVMKYLTGYHDIKDYLHPRSELDDTTLECVTEHRGRAQNLYAKSIDYVLPCALSYVADRIDYRGKDVIILDYKTGTYRPEHSTFDGYLGSMILYKWAMEQELNTTITKGYLIYPGEKKKYYQLDYSKENEEKLAESIDKFYKKFISDKVSRQYEFTGDGYFNTADAMAFKEIMDDNTIWEAQLPMKIYIGEHEDSVINDMIEKPKADKKEQ